MSTTNNFDNLDQELIRLFVGMFQVVGGDTITVVYHDANLADTSKKRWKNKVNTECTIASVERKKSKKGVRCQEEEE